MAQEVRNYPVKDGEIKSIQGINVKRDDSNFIDTSTINDGVLRILRSNTLGLFLSAYIKNPANVKAGKIFYYVPEILKTKQYAKAGTSGVSENNPSIPVVKTVSLELDQLGFAMFEIESFDEAAIQNWQEIEAQIHNGIAGAIQAELDLFLLMTLRAATKGWTAATKFEKTTKFQMVDAYSTDLEKIRLNRINLNDLHDNITTTITQHNLGTLPYQTVTLTNKRFYGRMLEGLGVMGGDQAIQLKLGGEIPGAVIGGNPIIWHMFMSKNVDPAYFAESTHFKKDEDTTNFEDVIAFVFNKEAVGFAVDIMPTQLVINPQNGNRRFITKYRYGAKVLRPDLIRWISNT